jgi:alanyl-tRNA synthetase
MADETPAVVNEVDEKTKKTLNETLGLLGVPVKERPASLNESVDKLKLETVKLLKDFDARSKDLADVRKEVKKLESQAAAPVSNKDGASVDGMNFSLVQVHAGDSLVTTAKELAEALKQQYVQDDAQVILVKKI